MLYLDIEADELIYGRDTGEASGFAEEEATCRIIGDEEGTTDRGIGRWLNSARLHVDSERDEVNCVVSIGDPRGGFCFTVRRTTDGRILLHTPHPSEGMPHMALREHHPGTYEVVSDGADPKPLTFEDEVGDEEEE